MQAFRAFKKNRKGFLSKKFARRYMNIVGADLHYGKTANAQHVKTIHLAGLVPTIGPLVKQRYYTVHLNDREHRVLAFVSLNDRAMWFQVIQQHTAVQRPLLVPAAAEK